MSNLVEHAKRECAFMCDGRGANQAMYDHLIHMVEEFSKEDHSGSSANYAANCLDRLFRFKPLRPLQGTDDEWVNISEDLYQNNRCPTVFKDGSGRAWNIDGKVFVEPDGLAYTNIDSRVPVTFPYVPETEFINVPEQEES